MTNASFPCSIDRIRGSLDASDQMYLINHYLDLDVLSIDISDPFAASKTNSVSPCVGSPSPPYSITQLSVASLRQDRC